MRKVFASVLLLLLLIPALAACGQAATSSPTAAPATTAPTSAPAPTTAPTAAATEAPTAAATAAVTEAAISGPVEDPSALRVGLVTDKGSVTDGTFNEFAHKGVLTAQEQYDFEYNFIETTSEADYAQNIQTFVDDGYNIIVTVGFLIQDATLAAAQEHPEIFFIGVDQFYTSEQALPNLIGTQFREDQGGFLAGAIAAMMSESGTIGIVAGQEIPPVKKFRNGYINGAQFVRPEIVVLDKYEDSFIDPAQGASTALVMLGEGADVIFGAGGPTGSGAIKAAAVEGAWVIGVDQDEWLTSFGSGSVEGSDRIITSAIKRVDVAVAEMIAAVIDGSFAEKAADGIEVFDAAGGGIGYADYHEAVDQVPDAVKQRMEQILTGLADGSITTGVDPVSGDVDEASIPEPQPFTP